MHAQRIAERLIGSLKRNLIRDYLIISMKFIAISENVLRIQVASFGTQRLNYIILITYLYNKKS